MQIYELKKGTVYHSKFLNAISQIDRWQLLTKELEELKRTKEHLISPQKIFKLMKKYDVEEISKVENVIKEDLGLKKVFGEESSIAADVNNFNFYVKTNGLLEKNNENENEFNIFEENYILSNITIDEFERLVENE